MQTVLQNHNKNLLFYFVCTDIKRTFRHSGCSRTADVFRTKSVWHQSYTKYSQLWVWRRTKHVTHQEDPGFVHQNLRHTPIFSDITTCSALKFNRRFRETCCLHLQKPGWNRALTVTCFTLVSFLAYSWTMKMEATCYSETSVDFQRNTWRYIPEDRTIHNNCSEISKSTKSKTIYCVACSRSS
jgi:hypothetical protein